MRISEGANHFPCGYFGNDHLIEGILRAQEPKPALRKRIPMPESVKVGRDGKVLSITHGTSYTYHLYAITQEDRQIKHATKLESPAAALFFEQQLEDWLHIVNEPVEGGLDSI